MRTSWLAMFTALSISVSVAGCATGDGVATLDNGAGKQDGLATAALAVSADHPSARARFTCDEALIDQCNIVLSVMPETHFNDAARKYLDNLDHESSIVLAGIQVTGPDGKVAPITLVTNAGDFPRQTVIMTSKWTTSEDGTPDFLFATVEGEYTHPGQFQIDSWSKGEYEIELTHTVLPSPLADTRSFFVTVYWE
jgi:hypothetical protein